MYGGRGQGANRGLIEYFRCVTATATDHIVCMHLVYAVNFVALLLTSLEHHNHLDLIKSRSIAAKQSFSLVQRNVTTGDYTVFRKINRIYVTIMKR